MFLIYFISGIGGYAVSGLFAPGQVALGADPAVYGLLGVLVVELFQTWPVCSHVQFRIQLIVDLDYPEPMA